MYYADTLASLNTKEELRSHLEKEPLKRLLIASDVQKSPDYAQVNIKLLEKVSGLTLVETFFVDSSGFGSSGEQALTYPVFEGKVKQLLKDKTRIYYSCLTGIGQFQVYISIFSKMLAPVQAV